MFIDFVESLKRKSVNQAEFEQFLFESIDEVVCTKGLSLVKKDLIPHIYL